MFIFLNKMVKWDYGTTTYMPAKQGGHFFANTGAKNGYPAVRQPSHLEATKGDTKVDLLEIAKAYLQ